MSDGKITYPRARPCSSENNVILPSSQVGADNSQATMPVPDEYAARTACRDHARICTKELRGSLRGHFYSECEGRHYYGRCKFSHTIFNPARVLSLVCSLIKFLFMLSYVFVDRARLLTLPLHLIMDTALSDTAAMRVGTLDGT
jgi:hypothetical protein